MAEQTAAAADAASVPAPADIERAARFTREPFVLDGEQPSEALAPGTPRRNALDDALAEIDAGAEHPSVEWRRTWSFLLGLERLLSEEEPKLVDGTVLSAHQVDALSGTLTALLAETLRQSNGNGNGNGAVAAGNGSAAPLAQLAAPADEDLDDDEDPDAE